MVARSSLPRPPRIPADLDDAPDETVWRDELDWSGVRITADCSHLVAHRAELSASRLIDGLLTGADLERARFVDVSVERSECSGVQLYGAALTRVRFDDCRMSGFVAATARLDDVSFVNCRLDGANFRQAKGARIRFEGCDLVGAEFDDVELTDARFYDCELREASFSRARVGGSRWHGSHLDDLRGAEGLREVTIDSAQIVPLALALYRSIGVHIDDDARD